MSMIRMNPKEASHLHFSWAKPFHAACAIIRSTLRIHFWSLRASSFALRATADRKRHAFLRIPPMVDSGEDFRVGRRTNEVNRDVRADPSRRGNKLWPLQLLSRDISGKPTLIPNPFSLFFQLGNWTFRVTGKSSREASDTRLLPPSPSSNRTCRFPASGSPVDLREVAFPLEVQDRSRITQTKQPQLAQPVIERHPGRDTHPLLAASAKEPVEANP